MSDFWVEAKEKKEGVFLIEHFNYSSLKIDQSPSGSSGVRVPRKVTEQDSSGTRKRKAMGKGRKAPDDNSFSH